MHFDDEIILLCVVDMEEEAVGKLTAYFLSLVDAIASGTFSQYMPEKKPLHSLRQRLRVSRELTSPSCFLLQSQSLCGAVIECRQSVAQALRAFDYPTYSPYISNVFGPEFVVEEGSAIEELFPAKPVGRPRKLRVQIPDSKQNYQILSQAVDEALSVACRGWRLADRYSLGLH